MSKEGTTEGDITWLIDKTITGKPTTHAGCETTCGTKHNWMIGITPAIDTSDITKTGRYKIQEIWKRVEAYTHQLVLVFNAKTTEGGFCTGSWDSDVSGSHKMKIIVQHYRSGRLHEKSELLLINSVKQYVNINGSGKFTVYASSEEWGEDCIKPKGRSQSAFKVSKEPDNMEYYNPDIGNTYEPMGSQTSLIDSPYATPLIIGGGVGVMLVIASLFKNP
jgi:hypothetical protein